MRFADVPESLDFLVPACLVTNWRHFTRHMHRGGGSTLDSAQLRYMHPHVPNAERRPSPWQGIHASWPKGTHAERSKQGMTTRPEGVTKCILSHAVEPKYLVHKTAETILRNIASHHRQHLGSCQDHRPRTNTATGALIIRFWYRSVAVVTKAVWRETLQADPEAP